MHLNLKGSYICFFQSSRLPSEQKTAEFWVHQYPARLARRQLQTLAPDETLLLPLPVSEPVAQLSRMQPMQVWARGLHVCNTHANSMKDKAATMNLVQVYAVLSQLPHLFNGLNMEPWACYPLVLGFPTLLEMISHSRGFSKTSKSP